MTSPRVYTGMVADLFHSGHVEFLRRARELGEELVVGIHSDEAVASYKRRTVMSMEERIEVVAGCRYVDEVIADAPLEVTREWIERHRIGLVVHGDDMDEQTLRRFHRDAQDLGIFRALPYTAGISTTVLIERVRAAHGELRMSGAAPHRIGVLADTHANHGALTAVLDHSSAAYGDELRFLQLGDLINYGPRPNEVIATVRGLTEDDRIVANLAGNHEAALQGVGQDRFSTERGLRALHAAADAIASDNREFVDRELSYEPVSLEIAGRSVLCVHGSLADTFWGALRGRELESEAYRPYDVVFCAHTHLPILYETYYEDADSPKRGKKKTTFVNPGSVGQPRNHDARAQYLVWDLDSGSFDFHRVAYDVAAEQRHYTDGIDPFYRSRLMEGV